MSKSRTPLVATLVAALSILPAPAAFADYTVRCGSDGGRYRTCRLNDAGYVSIDRQISGARCDQGRSWDYNRREIWVDHGCEADFRVETGSHDDSRKDAKIAAGVVAGALLLGALAAKNNNNDSKYSDSNYQGSRHSSYVPRWMVGRFRGYNPNYNADVEMTIEADGRVVTDANGTRIRGWINDGVLHVGNYIFSIDQTREGFVTSQQGDRHNEVRYRRVN